MHQKNYKDTWFHIVGWRLKRLALSIVMIGLLGAAPLAYAKHAQPTPSTVRILTWVGYIQSTDPYIKKIERTCHARIIYNEYKSNLDFLNLLRNSEYHDDVIIFSSTIYNIIAGDIADPDSTLYQASKDYYPIIRERYRKTHYAHNVVYFVHAMTGFLYNPKVIPSLPKDNIYDMFRKSKGQYVVMINDPVEANFLLNLAMHENENPQNSGFNPSIPLAPLDAVTFKQLYQGTNFIITNTPERIVTRPDFAFAYQWSGDALEMLRNNQGRLKFYIHPDLSYVSSDLLASLNHKPATICVARQLSSRWFLTHEQAISDYFSPYGGDHQNKDPEFRALCRSWIKHLPHLPWIASVDESTYNKLIETWDKIKFEVSMQNHR